MAEPAYKTAVWAYYRYAPNFAAAIVLTILFAFSAFTHLYQSVRTRTKFFIPFVIGGFFEVIGYAGRAASSKETPDWTMASYLVQTLFILLAPALFAAAIYMTLGRIILATDGEQHSPIARRWLTKLFVAGDVLSFLLQGAGGGIMAGGSLDAVHRGEKIVIGGLCVQVLFFGLFIVTAVVFNIRQRRARVPTAARGIWQKHLTVLYLASFLIMVRSLFRIIEYAMGNNGYLLRHEIFLYIFDALLMLAVMVLFNLVHPSEIQTLTRGGVSVHKVFMVEKTHQEPRHHAHYSHGASV